MKKHKIDKVSGFQREFPVVLLYLPPNEEFLRAIHYQSRELGWRIIDLRITHGDIPPGDKPVGLLFSGDPDSPKIRYLQRKVAHLVRLGFVPHPRDDRGVPAVLPDLTVAGQMAARHFAERNFKHVAYIGNDPWGQAKALCDGFFERAEASACECHLLQLKSNPAANESAIEKRLRVSNVIGNWLATLPKPVGLLCYDDNFAGHVCTMLMMKGIAVPEEVALLGVGNQQYECEFSPVPLSSVDVNFDLLTHRAVMLMHNLIQGDHHQEGAVFIPPKGVVERRSTNLLAVTDPVVGRALRFIWDNFEQQMAIADVAAEAGVARSTIARKFKQYLGRGVNAEIRRKRLESCTRLLRATNRTIEDIAAAIGFPSATYLYKAFRETYGMTPKQYRRNQRSRNRPEQKKYHTET